MTVTWKWGKVVKDIFSSMEDYTFTGTLEVNPTHFRVCAAAGGIPGLSGVKSNSLFKDVFAGDDPPIPDKLCIKTTTVAPFVEFDFS